MGAVDSGKASLGEAVALGFAGLGHGKPALTSDQALHSRVGPFGTDHPPAKAWLRRCPACRASPEISRRALYDRADSVVAR
jgi:hypothetical protein